MRTGVGPLVRKLARAAGLPRALSHSGRRAQLLAALAAA
jgi:hypothetical protein